MLKKKIDKILKPVNRIKDWIGLKLNPPVRKGKKRDFVFIHINKTGGTSIVDITKKPFRKHLTSKQVIKTIGKQRWEEVFKFCVVRNPWDKVVSHYKHNKKMNVTNMAASQVSFEDWLDQTIGPNQNYHYEYRPQMFLPQVEWIKNDQDEIDMDRIIRFENLSAEFKEVAEKIGIEPNLKHLNKTYKSHYKDFYNDKTRQMVADWYKEDIEYFGYTF